VLAGASLNIGMLPQMGLAGLVYLLARMAGKYTGARIGAHVAHANSGTGSLTGLSLMPQAGIAIGMALLTAEQYPEYGQMILSIVVSTTIFFEIVGPAMTRFALKRAAFEKVGE
jgi:Kef-type K+ transport system membrane component KefB